MDTPVTVHRACKLLPIFQHVAVPSWFQTTIRLRAKARGCHLVTDEVLRAVPQIRLFEVGLAHFFLKHTSASLTVNENYDPDVREDMEDSLNRIVPEDAPYRHTMEGPDDMPAHVKTALVGCELSIPMTAGKLNLGTWQGLYLCEHRDSPSDRSVVVTLQGMRKGGTA